jgi:hypothetical protein
MRLLLAASTAKSLLKLELDQAQLDASWMLRFIHWLFSSSPKDLMKRALENSELLRDNYCRMLRHLLVHVLGYASSAKKRLLLGSMSNDCCKMEEEVYSQMMKRAGCAAGCTPPDPATLLGIVQGFPVPAGAGGSTDAILAILAAMVQDVTHTMVRSAPVPQFWVQLPTACGTSHM